MKIGRAASTCSLLAFAVAAFAADYAELHRKLSQVQEPSEVVRLVNESPSIANDPAIQATLSSGADADKAPKLRAAIEMRAMLEQPAATPARAEAVKQIKSSPLYRDAGVEHTSNWLSRALERLRNLRMRQSRDPGANLGFLAAIGPLLYWFFWIVIAAGLGALLYFASKHITWKKRLQRRASALMEESEPERTLDEWVAHADRLEAEGRYREAVRALYLACLLRFDEALVARFDRSQTNWEHLRRIEASPRLPAETVFREPTRQFDQVWYGNRLNGAEDVSQFRRWYVELTAKLAREQI